MRLETRPRGPAFDRDIDIGRIDVEPTEAPPRPVGCHEVVGDPQRSLLGLGEAGQGDDWQLSQAHQPGGLKPSVTRDNMTFGISENWIGKAERLDRCAYLIDLALGMRARIARIGNEISDWTVGHGQPRRRFHCRYFVHAETPPKRTTSAGLRRSKIKS